MPKPVFLQDARTNRIFEEVVQCIPPKTRVFLVGGAARNAAYFSVFKRALPQRDYDAVVFGDWTRFIANLRKAGFTRGSIRRVRQLVLRKKKFPGAKEEADFVTLDLTRGEGRSLDLAHANFTINGFAIELRDLLAPDWKKRLVVLPTAWRDLKRKQLVVNTLAHPAQLFAALRFMSVGFKPPRPADVQRLAAELPKLPKKKRKRNLRKLYDYVGGKNNAERLAATIGVDLGRLLKEAGFA